MASRYRFSLEIDDIRDRIENLYSTVWWREMSLAAKIRTLVIERIEQLEQERSNPNPAKTQKDG
jgi:hypothetical protein